MDPVSAIRSYHTPTASNIGRQQTINKTKWKRPLQAQMHECTEENTKAYNKNKLYSKRNHVVPIKQPTNYNYCCASFRKCYYMGAFVMNELWNMEAGKI